MRAAGTALLAFLASTANNEFLRVDLYTLTLVDGTVLRYSGASQVTVGGNTYLRSGIKFKAGQLSVVVGLQVDNFELDLYASSEDTTSYIQSVPVETFARAGGFDGAYLKYERLIMPTWGDVSLGTVAMFYGYVSEVSPGRTTTKLSIASLIGKLNLKEPRDLYQTGCIHTLFDPGCALVKASFTVTGTCASGATTTVIPTDKTQADDYFALGVIIFTSGVNSGLRRSVRAFAHTAGAFTLTFPLPTAPSNGDTFSAYPGCDKTQATCTSAKFNNLANFRGYPNIPVAETAR